MSNANPPLWTMLALVIGLVSCASDTRLMLNPVVQKRTYDTQCPERGNTDTCLIPATRTIDTHTGITALTLITGPGSSLVFRVDANDRPIASFKPEQGLTWSRPDSEIAAWRLGQRLHCRFVIPRNIPVRLHRTTFAALFTPSPRSQRRAERKGKPINEELVYRNTPTGPWLHGTLEDWVTGLTPFPIEHRDIWGPWLKVGAVIPNTSARERYHRERLPGSARRQEKLLEQLGELSQKNLAREISDLLVVDALTTNWDRFEERPKAWGRNCHVAAGHLVAIDQGAAFPRYANPHPMQVLEDVERFNATLIQALRQLDRDATRLLLFPDTTPDTERRFERFWSQRQKILDRVDALVQTHGPEAIFFQPQENP